MLYVVWDRQQEIQESVELRQQTAQDPVDDEMDKENGLIPRPLDPNLYVILFWIVHLVFGFLD